MHIWTKEEMVASVFEMLAANGLDIYKQVQDYKELVGCHWNDIEIAISIVSNEDAELIRDIHYMCWECYRETTKAQRYNELNILKQDVERKLYSELIIRSDSALLDTYKYIQSIIYQKDIPAAVNKRSPQINAVFILNYADDYWKMSRVIELLQKGDIRTSFTSPFKD